MEIRLCNPHQLIQQYVLRGGGPRYLSGCYEHASRFLQSRDTGEKATIAIEAIRELINPYSKPELPDTLQRLYHLEEMLRRERNGRDEAFFEVQKKSRDHVIHALNTYLLGVLLIDELNLEVPEGFEFQWKVTSLFHDIGYPLEIATKVIDQSLVTPLNTLVPAQYRGQPFCVKFNLSRFLKLTTNDRSLTLIQNQLTNKWGLSTDAKSLYRSSTRTGNIKHGVVSSLLLMAHLDVLYKKNNPYDFYEVDLDGNNVSWARKNFFEDIVPCCAAIILHDAHKSNFTTRKISRDQATLPWLLRLTDALQDWDRPKSGSRDGIEAEHFRLGFSDGLIYFRCPEERVEGIWNFDLEAIEDKENIVRISKM